MIDRVCVSGEAVHVIFEYELGDVAGLSHRLGFGQALGQSTIVFGSVHCFASCLDAVDSGMLGGAQGTIARINSAPPRLTRRRPSYWLGA